MKLAFAGLTGAVGRFFYVRDAVCWSKMCVFIVSSRIVFFCAFARRRYVGFCSSDCLSHSQILLLVSLNVGSLYSSGSLHLVSIRKFCLAHIIDSLDLFSNFAFFWAAELGCEFPASFEHLLRTGGSFETCFSDFAVTWLLVKIVNSQIDGSAGSWVNSSLEVPILSTCPISLSGKTNLTCSCCELFPSLSSHATSSPIDDRFVSCISFAFFCFLLSSQIRRLTPRRRVLNLIKTVCSKQMCFPAWKQSECKQKYAFLRRLD